MILDPRTPPTWTFVLLNGKVPIVKSWQTGDGASRDAIEHHKGNIGLRTGTLSGVTVIDIDTAKGGTLPELPDTVTVRTGSGGLHLYYLPPPTPIGNSASKLAPHVDVRGNKGQVVYPGSIHPDTGTPYTWLDGHAPWDLPLAPFPEWALERLTARNGTTPAPPAQLPSRYAQVALDNGVQAIRSASEGSRNETLNRVSFGIAQLATGFPDERSAQDALRQAALESGLPEQEVTATIASGWAAGLQHPTHPEDLVPFTGQRSRTRQATAVPRQHSKSQPSTPGDPSHTVLIPGEHTEASGEIIEQGNHIFAEQVLDAIPGGVLYRWERIVGELVGTRGHLTFRQLDADRACLLIDRHIKLAKWRQPKDSEPVKIFCACTTFQAKLVLAAATTAKRVRELRMVTHYPVYAGPNWELSRPGWNQSTGVFYDEPKDLRNLTAAADPDISTLEDLVIDFPFRDEASRINLYGLMLTPLIRAAVSTVPIHLIQSSIERTGKGLMVNSILGAAVTGSTIPSVQLGEREEEREKRFTSLILEGETVIHLDNLPGTSILDSPSLASILTSSVWKGRTLGASSMPSLPNTLTLVASANNLRTSSEIAKRIVPIWLEPPTDNPEARTNFVHPDIFTFANSQRRVVLSTLLGLIANWIDIGRPSSPVRFGGFEQWATAIGGILGTHISTAGWLSNRSEWATDADEFSQDARSLVEAWWNTYQEQLVRPAQILDLCREVGVFNTVFARTHPAGQLISLGRYVLSPLTNRPVSNFRIRKSRVKMAALYYLAQNLETDTTAN
jgi:hypothetical protein